MGSGCAREAHVDAEQAAVGPRAGRVPAHAQHAARERAWQRVLRAHGHADVPRKAVARVDQLLRTRNRTPLSNRLAAAARLLRSYIHAVASRGFSACLLPEAQHAPAPPTVE